jgi:hypothetical protein
MNTPAAILEASRVDLIALIRNGIPERAYVPGCEPWLLAGKRYLIPATAGVGKSLAMETVAVAVVAAGGRVVILDVENGADEYARRLEDILTARDPGHCDRRCGPCDLRQLTLRALKRRPRRGQSRRLQPVYEQPDPAARDRWYHHDDPR